MLLPRPLNSYKYITKTKDVLFVLFGFHINMDISHLKSKMDKKMNQKKQNECTESIESSKSSHRSADYLNVLMAHL